MVSTLTPDPGVPGAEIVDQQPVVEAPLVYHVVNVKAYQPGEEFVEMVLSDPAGATQLVRVPRDPAYHPAPGDGALPDGKGGFLIKPDPRRDRSHIFPTTAGMTP